MPLRVLVLGEGKSEEGDGYYVPERPGQPFREEDLGAAHVLVRRILVAHLGSEKPVFVYPPRLRTSRRPGNEGLISDLEGAPRLPTNPRHKGWLEACVGNNRVDLIVLLKDCKIDGQECGVDKVIEELGSATAGRLPPGRTQVVKAGAKPSIEAWLLAHPESDDISEKEAKSLLEATGWNRGDAPSIAGFARIVDLAKLAAVCPEGFGRLVKDLRAAVEACKVPSDR